MSFIEIKRELKQYNFDKENLQKTDEHWSLQQFRVRFTVILTRQYLAKKTIIKFQGSIIDLEGHGNQQKLVPGKQHPNLQDL